jgi:hypothetical protein
MRSRALARSWQPQDRAVVGERLVLCGGEGVPMLSAPDGSRIETLPDAGAAGCVGLWPQRAGRYLLNAEEGTAPRAIDVFSADEIHSLRRAERREATTARASAYQASDARSTAALDANLVRALLLLGWLLLAGLVWWAERRQLLQTAD